MWQFKKRNEVREDLLNKIFITGEYFYKIHLTQNKPIIYSIQVDSKLFS